MMTKTSHKLDKNEPIFPESRQIQYDILSSSPNIPGGPYYLLS